MANFLEFQDQDGNRHVVGSPEVQGQTHALSVAVTYSENIETGMTFRTAPITNMDLEDVFWDIEAVNVDDGDGSGNQNVTWQITPSGVMNTSIAHTESYSLSTPNSDGETVGYIEITITDVASAKNLSLQEMQNEIIELNQTLRRMQFLPDQIGVIITSTPDNTPAHYPAQNPWFRASLDRVFTSWADFQTWYNANLQALSTVITMHIYVSENLGTTPNPFLQFRAGCHHIFYGLYEPKEPGGIVWSTDDSIYYTTTTGQISVTAMHPMANIEFHSAPRNPAGTSGSIGLNNFQNINWQYPDIQIPATFTLSINTNVGGRCFIADAGFNIGNPTVNIQNYNVMLQGNPIERGNWRFVNCDVRFGDDDALETSIPFLESQSEDTILRGRSTDGGDHSQIWHVGFIYDEVDGMVGKARKFMFES